MIAIIHYRDKNKYPPILNFTDYFECRWVKYHFFTGNFHTNFSSKFNILKYFVFTIRTFFGLLFSRGAIVYFESISAVPVAFYFFIFPLSQRKLFIHYHEYFSNSDYTKHSYFERLGRRLEQKLFHKARWISHTNQQRLAFFYEEFPYLEKNILKIMPNYPPQSWVEKKALPKPNKGIVKLVHIGSLSLEGMYLQEVLDHFGSNPLYSIDFYSHNFTNRVEKAIQLHDNCAIKGSIPYNSIPSLKGEYDVGLVLYKGLSVNFTYNAPNKIFEYLALDFDVWCSNKLITARDYQRLDCFPKVIMVNFESLNQFDTYKALDKNGLTYIPSPYICEPIYDKLLKAIDENTHS